MFSCPCMVTPPDCRVASHMAYAQFPGWLVYGPAINGRPGACSLFTRLHQEYYWENAGGILADTIDDHTTPPTDGGQVIHDRGGHSWYDNLTGGASDVDSIVINRASFDGGELLIDVNYRVLVSVSGPPGGRVRLILRLDSPYTALTNLQTATSLLTLFWTQDIQGLGGEAQYSYYAPGGVPVKSPISVASAINVPPFYHGGWNCHWLADPRTPPAFSLDNLAALGSAFYNSTGMGFFFNKAIAREYTSNVEILDSCCEFRAAYGGPVYCDIDALAWPEGLPSAQYIPHPGGIIGTVGAENRYSSHRRIVRCRPNFNPVGSYFGAYNFSELPCA